MDLLLALSGEVLTCGTGEILLVVLTSRVDRPDLIPKRHTLFLEYTADQWPRTEAGNGG